jgi:GTP cyclohydrolase II
MMTVLFWNPKLFEPTSDEAVEVRVKSELENSSRLGAKASCQCHHSPRDALFLQKPCSALLINL